MGQLSSNTGAGIAAASWSYTEGFLADADEKIEIAACIRRRSRRVSNG